MKNKLQNEINDYNMLLIAAALENNLAMYKKTYFELKEKNYLILEKINNSAMAIGDKDNIQILKFLMKEMDDKKQIIINAFKYAVKNDRKKIPSYLIKNLEYFDILKEKFTEKNIYTNLAETKNTNAFRYLIENNLVKDHKIFWTVIENETEKTFIEKIKTIEVIHRKNILDNNLITKNTHKLNNQSKKI